jgi:hypothetical protein
MLLSAAAAWFALAAPISPTGCAATDGVEIGPRLAQWVERRKAKCSELRPYEATFLEKQLLAFEKAERPGITQWNLGGLYPRIQSIDHRSQYAAGLRLWRPDLGDSRFDLSGSAFWSLQGYQYYDTQVGVLPHRGQVFPLLAIKGDDVFELSSIRAEANTPYMLYGSFLYRWAPRFDYFGIGPDSKPEDQSDFRLSEQLYEIVAGYRVLPRLTLSGRFGYDLHSIGEGQDDELPAIEDVFPPATVPGFTEQPDFLRYGAAAIFDSRDVAQNPHRGALLAATWQRYDQRGGGDAQGFSRLAGDVRLYLPLGNRQRVLALRAYASQDTPVSGARVPFYLLSYLGSSHTLRAFASQRFRGERLALAQAEYRWEASPAIELAAFVDSGAVAATRDDRLGRLRTDGGVGLRFKSHEAVLLRFDFAWGGEGFRFLFRFSPAF